MAGIFPLLFNVIGDALGQLRRAPIEVMLEVDVDPHVVRTVGRHAIVEKNGRCPTVSSWTHAQAATCFIPYTGSRGTSKSFTFYLRST